MTIRRARSRIAPVTAAGVAVLLISGCGADGEPEPSPSVTSPPAPAPTAPSPDASGAPQVIADGLRIPWDVDFLPDGAALVTERDSGRILRVGPDTAEAGLEVREERTIDGIDPTAEGGLLGIAVSPDYQTDESVFVYYTTEQDNRIARLRPGEDPEPVLTGIPHSPVHNGGRLAFGPDGFLYASTGDAGRSGRSQDRGSLAGKILRITADGAPAPGNPFDSPVWAYGLRNVQGLAWDAEERLWATEFGDREWDELNLIEPGENYGWPEVEGEGGGDDFVEPAVTWPVSEASCSGVAATGGLLTVACLRGQRLWQVELTTAGAVLGAPEPLLVQEYGRLRAVVVAPDGSLWVTTSNRDGRAPSGPDPDDDRILRLLPDAGGGVGQS